MSVTHELSHTLDAVRQGWIPTRIYSDPAVFDAEKRTLFNRTWHFLAHESEIPNDGDYVVRRVLEELIHRGARRRRQGSRVSEFVPTSRRPGLPQ